MIIILLAQGQNHTIEANNKIVGLKIMKFSEYFSIKCIYQLFFSIMLSLVGQDHGL